VLRRLAEAGESAACDHPLDGVEPVLRNVVSFVAAAELVSPRSYFEEFATYLRTQYPHMALQTRATWWSRESFELSWFENHFHKVAIRTGDRLVIEHNGPLAVSEWLHDWLIATPRFTEIRWYTPEAWSLGRDWQDRPW
jgi:hypothetical protein